ncbi:MAG TPA: alpha/beta fold hydrolase [Holophaga sp.]|nr:alpha/beta fold hydrolase [Holophaga sp.]
MTNLTTLLPEDLEPTHRGVLDGHSDTSLAFVRWEHSHPKGRVVISHGYGEHSERYRHVAKWLHDLGWSVSAMDHRGFGRSGGRRGDANGIHAFVEDLTLFLRHERRYDADRMGAGARMVEGVPMPPLPVCPQILLGHSFGGLVALLTLLWHSDTLEGLILTSPAVALRPLGTCLKLLQKLALWAAPHKPIQLPNDKRNVCSDPIMVQRYWDDPLCHRYVSAAFAEALAQGKEEIIGFGHELDARILLLEAGQDGVVDPDGAEALWANVRQELLERHRLEAFRHEILHDRRRPEAERLIEDWLDRLLVEWSGTPDALLS